MPLRGGGFINFWLGLRIGRLRIARKVEMGDGNDPLIYARMRAQSNFIENTPITLIFCRCRIGGQAAGGSRLWARCSWLGGSCTPWHGR
jgi:hypothetical protein